MPVYIVYELYFFRHPMQVHTYQIFCMQLLNNSYHNCEYSYVMLNIFYNEIVCDKSTYIWSCMGNILSDQCVFSFRARWTFKLQSLQC